MNTTPEPDAGSTPIEPLDPIDPATDDSDEVTTDPEVTSDPELADSGYDGPSEIPVKDRPDGADAGTTADLTD